MVAFEAKLPLYRSQNVQVLGVSIDNTVDLAKWGTDIGLSFSLLGDETGQLSKQCGLYNLQQTSLQKLLQSFLMVKQFTRNT